MEFRAAAEQFSTEDLLVLLRANYVHMLAFERAAEAQGHDFWDEGEFNTERNDLFARVQTYIVFLRKRIGNDEAAKIEETIHEESESFLHSLQQ
jgi:hypothetical protein